MNDTRIWSVLKPMHPAVLEDMPLDGTWLEPPFANDAAGRAVICNDGDFQFVVVNRKSGAVLYVCEDEETLMASSLATLPAIVAAWNSIDNDTVGPEDDEDFSAVKKSFQEQLKLLDPQAAATNEFWSLYTDELTNEDYVDIDDMPVEEEDPEPDSGDNDRPGADESFVDA
ncbi:SUKH-4 family immunity protein [Arthrobacter sp. E3]|uniref:SUKH-4 family immunity protein n=1 Tax=Arthrobacter sp. E3 TaxID=517402 RepID=UPI001A946AB3|nr:SUKH-4 family immunity protein [Arthrobacter sp. E3]